MSSRSARQDQPRACASSAMIDCFHTHAVQERPRTPYKYAREVCFANRAPTVRRYQRVMIRMFVAKHATGRSPPTLLGSKDKTMLDSCLGGRPSKSINLHKDVRPIRAASHSWPMCRGCNQSTPIDVRL
eukprot:6337554-Pyramimonas_sp.AAC.1